MDRLLTVIRLEAGAVKAWAQTASPTNGLRLTRDIGVKVGTGVVRATGQLSHLQKVRVVLVYKSYNGMPYYILTAFPVP